RRGLGSLDERAEPELLHVRDAVVELGERLALVQVGGVDGVAGASQLRRELEDSRGQTLGVVEQKNFSHVPRVTVLRRPVLSRRRSPGAAWAGARSTGSTTGRAARPAPPGRRARPARPARGRERSALPPRPRPRPGWARRRGRARP